MKQAVILCAAIALTCAAAVFPAAAGVSNERTQHRTHVRYVGAIPVSVEFLPPTMLAPVTGPEVDQDGMTRDAGECSRGCVDD